MTNPFHEHRIRDAGGNGVSSRRRSSYCDAGALASNPQRCPAYAACLSIYPDATVRGLCMITDLVFPVWRKTRQAALRLRIPHQCDHCLDRLSPVELAGWSSTAKTQLLIGLFFVVSLQLGGAALKLGISSEVTTSCKSIQLEDHAILGRQFLGHDVKRRRSSDPDTSVIHIDERLTDGPLGCARPSAEPPTGQLRRAQHGGWLAGRK